LSASDCFGQVKPLTGLNGHQLEPNMFKLSKHNF